jgi:hypothetical protein
MVGGFGQLPGVGAAGGVFIQVRLALMLTSASQPNQCPSCVASVQGSTVESSSKLPFLAPRGHVADGTVRAK